MSGLLWALVKASGRGRLVLVASCTAIVSGLLLVAVAIAQLPRQPREALFEVVRDPGTRGGMVFAIVLCVIPPLLLLYQALRLGTAARERRLAALRLAGATPTEVRRIGAVEVGAPALAGGVVGIAIYGFLRVVIGGRREWNEPGLKLVPTTVTPAWWQFLVVVLVVTALGVAVGAWAGRGVLAHPLGVVRRARRRPPRPWGLLAILAGALVFLGSVHWFDALGHAGDDAVAIAAIALVVLGMVSLAPWGAYVAGRAASRRASSAPVLLAASRLVTDPRSTGRAAAAVGGIGLAAGGVSVFVADLLSYGGGSGDGAHYVSVVLICAMLGLALVSVIATLAVHSVESLLERRRSVSALAALGAPRTLFYEAQRWEIGLVAVPMSVAGVLLGGLGYGSVALGETRSASLLVTLVPTLVVVPALVWFAIRVTAGVTRPWTDRAVDPRNLRAE